MTASRFRRPYRKLFVAAPLCLFACRNQADGYSATWSTSRSATRAARPHSQASPRVRDGGMRRRRRDAAHCWVSIGGRASVPALFARACTRARSILRPSSACAAFPLLRTTEPKGDQEQNEKLWSLMSSYLASGACGPRRTPLSAYPRPDRPVLPFSAASRAGRPQTCTRSSVPSPTTWSTRSPAPASTLTTSRRTWRRRTGDWTAVTGRAAAAGFSWAVRGRREVDNTLGSACDAARRRYGL
jgi:hypothetical protein